MQNVNEARCRNQIQKNTLDPILFLETQGKIFESEAGERLGKSSQFSHFLASDELDIQLKKQIFHLDNFGQLEIRNLRPHADGFLRGDIEVEAGEDTSLIPNKIIHLGKERTINIKAKKS